MSASNSSSSGGHGPPGQLPSLSCPDGHIPPGQILPLPRPGGGHGPPGQPSSFPPAGMDLPDGSAVARLWPELACFYMSLANLARYNQPGDDLEVVELRRLPNPHVVRLQRHTDESMFRVFRGPVDAAWEEKALPSNCPPGRPCCCVNGGGPVHGLVGYAQEVEPLAYAYGYGGENMWAVHVSLKGPQAEGIHRAAWEMAPGLAGMLGEVGELMHRVEGIKGSSYYREFTLTPVWSLRRPECRARVMDGVLTVTIL
ncbi:hypothetical protein B0T18DRAFT_398265 [Schizothecium vesticola]|uniref:Uncharacterized protein n=1 Tax=Schizothecium vesticola TaxID=314040 RepID=A0AA40FA55_9PEZI|nr:hypothetical protein B0T18DRAFT_398265 [Schizothecium vesticola]